MATTDTDVLIVGAGPTGLTLACGLARSGISFRIVEAAAEPQQGSRGKGVQPRTLEVFDDLGIIDTVLAHGRLAMPIRSMDAEGNETLSGGGTPVPRPDTPYTGALLTPEWRVEEALRDRLAGLGSNVAFGSELIGFEQSDAGVSATVMLNAKPQTIGARWLVGCDGGRSSVRKLAGIDFLGETLEAVRMIVADVRAGLNRDFWQMWQSAEGFAALCPLPSTDQFQLQISIASGQNPDLSLANMQSLLDRRSGRKDIRLHGLNWSSLWRANVRMVDRYRSGRVFLAGDAAHVHSPAGGQGMNTGIQDAHNISWKLAAVIKGASPALLDTYQAERLPIAAGVLALSNELLRQSIAERSIVIVRDQRTLQLGLGYRGSSLARDHRGKDALLQSGDRAPDAPGLITRDGEQHLFDLTRGEHFTLLSFGAMVFDFEAPGSVCLRSFHVVAAVKRPNDLVDRDGHLRSAYQPIDGTIVLIRPDGYVALIADAEGELALLAYFAELITAPLSV